jgi:FixJ family two-component response regulator
MKNVKPKCIFVVDDDSNVLKVLGSVLESQGYQVKCFTDAATCLGRLKEGICHLLIADVRMRGLDGIGLLREARSIAPWMPVLMITGYGDIPTATTAIKLGASDFIEKPLEREAFLEKVKSLLEENSFIDSLKGKPLTPLEQKVLKLVIDGKTGKDIARLLCRAERTIEGHRERIMRKLGVDNLVDLVKHAALMKLVCKPPVKEKK